MLIKAAKKAFCDSLPLRVRSNSASEVYKERCAKLNQPSNPSIIDSLRVAKLRKI